MTAAAVGLILIAAVLHALWNLLAKRVGGGPALVWLYGTTSTLVLMPLAIAVMVVQRPSLTQGGVWLLLAGSMIHAIYFVVLQRAYGEGDFSVVYPVVRGQRARIEYHRGDRSAGRASLGVGLLWRGARCASQSLSSQNLLVRRRSTPGEPSLSV